MDAILRSARRAAPLVTRTVAAVAGGYALAALASVAALALPGDPPQRVLWGMLASFIVYTGAIVWMFAARSATRGVVGMVMAAVPLLLAAWSAGALGAHA